MVMVVTACEKASPPADPAIEQFMADFEAYGDKSVVMLAKFNGDCSATADQMLTLEPLAKKLRAEGGAIEDAKLHKRTAELKAKVMLHYEELLKPLNMTIDDISTKEAEMKAKCGNDPKWQDAQERTGLMKKKSK
jgi:hypothetical protein